jgi:hypothetical protein
MTPTVSGSPGGPGLARILRMGGLRGDAVFSDEFDAAVVREAPGMGVHP